MLKPKSVKNTTEETALSLSQCIAKTCTLADGRVVAGVNISAHCQIVGLVARELISRMPVFLRNELFPAGSELIAAVHDLGKISPTFQEKLYRATEDYDWNSLPSLKNIDPSLEKNWGGHAGASQAALDGVGKFIAEVAGRHHGANPSSVPLPLDQNIGGQAWQEQRMELLKVLKNSLAVEFPKIQNSIHANLLAGLTTVADWIGSGHFFDRIRPDGTANVPWIKSISMAVDESGCVQPKLIQGLGFQEIFGFEPRDAQVQLIESATRAGVYVLEAPMGMGKTEAALYAAYQALSLQQATGIYFALPTQLTSNKIHERVTQFLAQILAPDCPHRRALLLHGSAWLLETEMGEEGQPGQSWFNSSKRGILAPFAVGTIDQALMAVMNVKHGFVRTFGLAGKVVILDEVHTYDSYTGTIMDELISTLQELHCTVIVLSATLTQNRRRVLMGLETCALSESYPLISAKPKDANLEEIAIGSQKDLKIEIQFNPQNLAFEEALQRAEQGQQVLWIENTVAEAQEIYKLFAARNLGMEVGILHSRFLKTHREKNESFWVKKYGKEGVADRYQTGRILVGTQVLEQSLDIDADFMVSRICPTDMLFQRLGRLWRHRQNDAQRPPQSKCEAWILSPNLENAQKSPEKFLGKTTLVYAPYILCRTIEVWQDLNQVCLPSQIRTLLEATYAERSETDSMAKFKLILDKEKDKLGCLARVGLSSLGRTLPESKASTRHSDQESCELLLLKSIKRDQEAVCIQFVDGTWASLVENAKAKNVKTWRKIAAEIARNTMQIPVYMAPKAVEASRLKILENYIYLGKKDEDESLLRIAFLKDDLSIQLIDGGTPSDIYQLEYRKDYGYLVTKINPQNTEEEGW